ALLRGGGGLWRPPGLLADLTAVTGPDAGPATPLHDARLSVLEDEPGVSRLRALAAGQPSWGPAARAAFAALLAARLDIPARYTPPGDAGPAELATALAAALAQVGPFGS